MRAFRFKDQPQMCTAIPGIVEITDSEDCFLGGTGRFDLAVKMDKVPYPFSKYKSIPEMLRNSEKIVADSILLLHRIENIYFRVVGNNDILYIENVPMAKEHFKKYDMAIPEWITVIIKYKKEFIINALSKLLSKIDERTDTDYESFYISSALTELQENDVFRASAIEGINKIIKKHNIKKEDLK